MKCQVCGAVEIPLKNIVLNRLETMNRRTFCRNQSDCAERASGKFQLLGGKWASLGVLSSVIAKLSPEMAAE